MTKYINTALYVAAFVFTAAFGAHGAQAATVYLESSRDAVSVGDTIVVAVKINADGAVINTVDGEVALDSAGSLIVDEFSLANSAFGLWPRTPSLATDLRTISFVGGVPGGFSIEGATVFKIILQAKKEGIVAIAPQNISVFANDGKGTKIPVQVKGVTVQVVAKKQGAAVQNDWSSIVAGDVTPPSDFIIVYGQDQTIFSGKKFAFFTSVDNQSGIDHYEVSENGGPSVRSGSTYVLNDQSGDSQLTVVAYDKAGNKTTSSTVAGKSVNWIGIAIIVLIIVILYFIYKKWRNNKKHAQAPQQQA